MSRQSIRKIHLCTLLLVAQTLIWGCASQKPIVATEQAAARICGDTLSSQMSDLETHELGSFLSRAESEGGAVCWSESIRSALEQNKPIPRDQLIKALNVFNHNINANDFHGAVGQYLHSLANEAGSYTEEDRNLLEAYSRYVIRTARSQNDDNLKMAQIACARLDRDLYARLFK